MPVDADPAGPVPPHASAADLAAVSDLEHELVEERPVAIRALLAATLLLRIGTVGAGLSVQFLLSDSGVEAKMIGFVASVNLLAELVFAPVLARFADRLGRTRFLIGGPLIGSFGLVLVALAIQPSQIAGARLLEGVAAAAFVPTALGTIAAATSHSVAARARAAGAFEASNLGGFAIGGLFAGFVFHSLHHLAFLVFALFYVAAGVVCLRFIPSVPPLPVSPIGVIVKAVIGKGPIRTFLPAWLAAFAIITAFLANIAGQMKSGAAEDPTQHLVHHFDERIVSLVLPAGLILLVVGIVLWTPTLAKRGSAITMRRAVPGAGVLCATLLAVNHTPLQYAPFFAPALMAGIVMLAGFGPAAVAYLAECSETFAADRSALMAFYTLTLAAGGLVGGIAGGFAAQWLKIDGLALLGLGLAVLAWVALNRVVIYERAMVAARPAA